MENHRHLGGLPEPWEVEQGSIAERTAKVGRSAIDYRELTNQKDASGESKSWMKVQSLGQESMQLMLGDEDPMKPSYGALAADDDHVGVKQPERLQEVDEESTDASDPAADINAILDADYDTSTWSVHEIESACNTLLAECESTLVVRRRVLSTRMLLRLVDRHPEARKFVEVAFETIVNRGIPSMSYGISERTFCVAHLLAAVSPRLAEKLSTLNVTPRIFKMINREATLAAQVLQNRVRLKARYRADMLAIAQGHPPLPLEVVARQRLMANMKTDDLNQRLRHLRHNPMGGRVPPEVLLSYLLCVVEVTSSDHPKYAGLNRHQVVKAGGLVIVVGCLKHPDPQTRAVARKIVLNLAQEPTLLRAVLSAQAVPALMRAVEEPDPLIKCSALEVLDALADNAVEVAGLAHATMSLESLESGGATPGSAADADATALLKLSGSAHDLNPSVFAEPLGSDAQEEDLGAANRAEIRRNFITKTVVRRVLEQLFNENAEVFLGSIVVVHKMACSVFYHVVLDEIVAGAGAVLERSLDALQSNNDILAVAVCSLLCHMCTRPEGRDAVVTGGAVGMLAPLVGRSRDMKSREFVLALTIITSLAEHATLPPIAPTSSSLDVRIEKLTDRLYHNMMASVARPPPAADHFVRRLQSMNMISSVLRFLVRPEAPTHIFDLTKQQRFLGGLILHRMCCCHEAGGAEALFHEATILYGCFLVQHNLGEMVDGSAVVATSLSPEDLPLFFLSTQAACSLLAELAGASAPPNARSLVALKLKRTNAIQEVSAMLRYPEAKYDPLYRLKMECVVAATLLVANVAPRPEADTLPESDLELLKNEMESAAACAGALHELVTITAKPLFLIVQCCENRSAVAAACLALSRLAGVNDSCSTLIGMDAVSILAKLVPSRPTVKHNMTSVEKDNLMRGDAVQMVRLSPSFFRLLGSLARLPDGVAAIQAEGLLKRSVERMSMGDGGAHDLAVKTEIALLLSRLGNKHSTEFGSTTELILTSKFGVVPTLLRMLPPHLPKRTRYCAARALRSLCEDLSRGAPVVASSSSSAAASSSSPSSSSSFSSALLPTITAAAVVKAGGDGGRKNGGAISLLVSVLCEEAVPQPLLRECVQALRLMASSPSDSAAMADRLVESGAAAALQHIAVDAELDAPYRDSAMAGIREGLGDAAREALSLITDSRRGSGRRRSGSTAATQMVPQLQSAEGAEEVQHEGSERQRGKEDEQDPLAPRTRATTSQDVVGVPPPPGEDARKRRDGKKKEEGVAFDGTYTAVGVGAHGSLISGLIAESGGEEATPLALLSARDKGFRSELRHRKRYYQLDRSGSIGEDDEGGEDEDDEVKDREGGSSRGERKTGRKGSDPARGEVSLTEVRGEQRSEDGGGGGGGSGDEARPNRVRMPVVPLKQPKDPFASSDRQHQQLCATVASLEQNPHLKRTRPGTKPPKQQQQQQQNAMLPPATQRHAKAPIPLVHQPRNQQVLVLPPPGKQPRGNSSHQNNTLMLDPVFGDSMVNESGDQSKASLTGSVKQISAATLGSEHFQHSATILGHRVGVTYQRVVPGRVSHSSSHAEIASFKNVEGSVTSLMANREGNATTRRRQRQNS